MFCIMQLQAVLPILVLIWIAGGLRFYAPLSCIVFLLNRLVSGGLSNPVLVLCSLDPDPSVNHFVNPQYRSL